MAFYFTDDVFLLNLAFEAAERAFQRLVIAEFHFCQTVSPAFQSWQFWDLTFAAARLTFDFDAISEKCGC